MTTPNQLTNFNVQATHVAGASTTTVKTGAGFLARLCVNTSVTGTVTLYDNTAGSGTVLAVLTLAAGGPSVLALGLPFATGLTAVVVGAQDLTYLTQ